jgi:hypothetical protein
LNSPSFAYVQHERNLYRHTTAGYIAQKTKGRFQQALLKIFQIKNHRYQNDIADRQRAAARKRQPTSNA